MFGLIVCAAGFLFGLVIYTQLKNLPVHRSMREISELIYETCKTYLVTQGKLLLVLELFIGAIILLYYRRPPAFPRRARGHHPPLQPHRHRRQLRGAWFGIRINTFANSRTAFASLRGKPFLLHAIPMKAG